VVRRTGCCSCYRLGAASSLGVHYETRSPDEDRPENWMDPRDFGHVNQQWLRDDPREDTSFVTNSRLQVLSRLACVSASYERYL
jgi:hypothetical protein